MISRLWQIRLMSTLVGLGTYASSSASQDVPHLSTAMVLRYQLGSIAEEVVGKIQLEAKSAVVVSVQPYARRNLAENAFVESLQNRGYRPILKREVDSAGINLIVTVLNDHAQFKEIGQKAYERTVQTELEARTERNDGESIAYLGIFHRVSSDTVSAKDVEVPLPVHGNGVDEEATFFQRLVGPFIILASGIIVVYLFFTVRS
jgi:hypothetical protein